MSDDIGNIMSDDIGNIPVFWLPASFTSEMKKAALTGTISDGSNPWEYMNTQLANIRTALENNQAQDDYGNSLALASGSGWVAGVLGFAAAGPIGWVGGVAAAVYSAFSSDKVVRLIVINDTDEDLILDEVYFGCGEQIARPALARGGGKYDHLNIVPRRKSVGNSIGAGFGCFAFHKSKTMLISFEGAGGVISFKPLGTSKSPIDFGWQVPENGKNSSYPAFVSAVKAEGFYDDVIDDNRPEGGIVADGNYKLTCRVNDINVSDATVTCLVEQI